MQFSSICSFALVVLATSALAVPAHTENTESLANVEVSEFAVFPGNSVSMKKLRSQQAPAMLEKRLGPIAILLINVIGGKLFAGAMSAGIEVAKDALAPSANDFKDFNQVS